MAQTLPQIALPDYPSEIQADPRELSLSREQLLKMYSAMRLARSKSSNNIRGSRLFLFSTKMQRRSGFILLREQHGLPRNGPLVLATVGSGSDGFPVLDAARAAVERLRTRMPDLAAVLVTVPYMPDEQKAMLQARATPSCPRRRL